MPKIGQKHAIKCRCILTQHRSLADPPFFQFIVFSVVNDDGSVEHRLSQCPNCGIIHRVVDLTRSEIIGGRDSSAALVTVDDVRQSIPPQLAAILDRLGADISTWEAAKFCLCESRWGDAVTVTSDVVGDLRQGKYVRIMSPALFSVETFSRNELLTP